MWFVIFQFLNSKKHKGANFHKDCPHRTQVITISLDTENSKWRISGKKALKLPKFQKPISQELLKIGEKILLIFVSYK